jgi:hypothetical protein
VIIGFAQYFTAGFLIGKETILRLQAISALHINGTDSGSRVYHQ